MCALIYFILYSPLFSLILPCLPVCLCCFNCCWCHCHIFTSQCSTLSLKLFLLLFLIQFIHGIHFSRVTNHSPILCIYSIYSQFFLLPYSLYSSGFCAYYCFCGNFTVAWLSNLYIISTSRKYTCNKRLFTFSHSSISYSALQIPLCQCHTTTAHPSVLLLLHNILLNGSVCWLYFTKGMTLKEWNSWESAKAKALTILSIHNTYSTDKHT